MHLLNPLTDDFLELSGIFERIFQKNAITFLGAGSSITDYQFLSKDLIALFEAKISKHFGTDDITKFVDILQVTPGLRRGDFDKFVVDRLEQLIPGAGHSIFVTVPWKQVITTNFDTLIEEAAQKALRERKTHYNLRTVRNKAQLDVQSSNNEILYIKLHGCKSDLSQYPLLFSTDDFAKNSAYYKKVLSPFKIYSNEILFIAFGYSFADPFAERLFEKILATDIRQKRLVYCVDPFVNIDKLGYYESKNIAVVKMTFEEFFLSYQNWYESNNKNYLKGLQRFTNPDNSLIKIETATRLYLDKSVIQLKDDYGAVEKIKKYDFYFGAEPNYQVVVDDFDVVKRLELEQFLSLIGKSFSEHSKTTIPKLLLINGDFGTGKTTFALRTIKEYLRRNNNVLAFEIVRSIGVKKGYLANVIKESSATQFIFYSDNIETDSVFKSFNELRIDLATEQYSDISIIFISSIRENILQKYKNLNKLAIANNIEFVYNAAYRRSELQELVSNLKEVGLLDYRDTVGRDAIVTNLYNKYKGHSFLSLYGLIENGSHYKLLQKAYIELTPIIKEAFKITALVHRFNMDCPAGVIVSAIKELDWNDFENRVVRGDGKNILIQSKESIMGPEPDLYFRTKHPVIAEALVKRILTNDEKNSLYKTIFSNIPYSEFNATFVVDLIKSIRLRDNDITAGQRDNYFELCRKTFESSPHFLVSYITNIEKGTSSVKRLAQCIRDIELLESDLEYRNNRLIHRKGSLSFKIARLLKDEGAPISEVKDYIASAREWFEIKRKLDPSSSYSYFDYIKLLIWSLKNLKIDDAEKVDINLSLSNLFDEAQRLLYEYTTALTDLFEEYRTLMLQSDNNDEYISFLLDRYQNVTTRPQAAILLYFYYYDLDKNEKCENLISELESYQDNKDVVYFLFKHYGRNLHSYGNRVKFSQILLFNEFLKDMSPMRFHYFSSVLSFYDYRWKEGRSALARLNTLKQSRLNPDFFLYWRTEGGDIQLFDAEITRDAKVTAAKIVSPVFQTFPLVAGDYKMCKEGDPIVVELQFMFEGVRARIVDASTDS